MEKLTPKQIVTELDRYIIGQDKAKRAVAIALRNRWRRQQLKGEIKDEVVPKNIIMIGNTGVGKTEVARRLAKLAQAPFLKIEVTKFTEVGYVGRDCESMIRDLIEMAVKMVKEELYNELKEKADSVVTERLVDLLMRQSEPSLGEDLGEPFDELNRSDDLTTDFDENEVIVQHYKQDDVADNSEDSEHERQLLKEKVKSGELDEAIVDIDSSQAPGAMVEIFSSAGVEELGINIQDMIGGLLPRKSRKRSLTIKEARNVLQNEELQKMVDMDKVVQIALERVENSGIIFLDEIDKIAGRESKSIDVSREGVQRDLLPIIEGSAVSTKYGMVRTDHILFLAAGAFHISKPSDLIPELQGRFPVRVKLQSLSKDDLVRILTEPQNCLIKQYTALLGTEGVELAFTSPAIEAIASAAIALNKRTEDIGARRLHMLLERLLDTVSYEAPNCADKFHVDEEYVLNKLNVDKIIKDDDLITARTVGFRKLSTAASKVK